jgi:ubiquitin carboxyl-terminal hydrolase 36/42
LTIYLEAILNSSFSEKPSRAHVIKNQSQTPLFKLFGGKLRSQITCERCNYKSDTFDETFTLPVQLSAGSGEATLGQALKEFCSVDSLTKNNKYLCPMCKSKQNATKRTSINQAPRILIFTIKRFDPFGRKIQTKIRYPIAFNAKAHMDQAVDGKVPL